MQRLYNVDNVCRILYRIKSGSQIREKIIQSPPELGDLGGAVTRLLSTGFGIIS